MDFTYWTPQEVVDFVKQYGAKIRETGVRLMSPEACGTPPEYTDPIITMPEHLHRPILLQDTFIKVLQTWIMDTSKSSRLHLRSLPSHPWKDLVDDGTSL